MTRSIAAQTEILRKLNQGEKKKAPAAEVVDHAPGIRQTADSVIITKAAAENHQAWKKYTDLAKEKNLSVQYVDSLDAEEEIKAKEIKFPAFWHDDRRLVLSPTDAADGTGRLFKELRAAQRSNLEIVYASPTGEGYPEGVLEALNSEETSE